MNNSVSRCRSCFAGEDTVVCDLLELTNAHHSQTDTGTKNAVESPLLQYLLSAVPIQRLFSIEAAGPETGWKNRWLRRRLMYNDGKTDIPKCPGVQ